MLTLISFQTLRFFSSQTLVLPVSCVEVAAKVLAFGEIGGFGTNYFLLMLKLLQKEKLHLPQYSQPRQTAIV